MPEENSNYSMKKLSQSSSTKDWLSKFNAAIASARSPGIREMIAIKSVSDYYTFLNALLF
jgi:hypothetical protein